MSETVTSNNGKVTIDVAMTPPIWRELFPGEADYLREEARRLVRQLWRIRMLIDQALKSEDSP